MEHIPRPVSSTSPVPLIPYLGGDYDRKGFFGFLERKGYSWQDAKEAKFKGQYGSPRFAAVFQACFFFAYPDEFVSRGVLGVCEAGGPFKSQIPPADLLQDVDGKLYLSTSNLSKHILRCNAQARARSTFSLKETGDRVRRIVDIFAIAFAYYIDSTQNAGADLLPGDSLIAIWVMLDTLALLSFSMYGIPLRSSDTQGLDKWIGKELRSKGFCNYAARKLIEDKPPSLLYFISRMTWPSFRGRHKSCSNDACTADNIDEFKYRTRHIYANCKCGAEGPDTGQLSCLVQDNRIPLIKINLLWRDCIVPEIALESFRCDSETAFEYVALSHVWADGLGNVKDNKLPRCQLVYLAQKIHELQEKFKSDGSESLRPLYIWIDTLCVPREEESRKRAIRSIRQVYKRAKFVLVLDATMMNVNWRINQVDSLLEVSGGSVRSYRLRGREEKAYARMLEALVRLHVSPWAQRLWTLQEAVYAESRLLLQFADQVVAPASLCSIQTFCHQKLICPAAVVLADSLKTMLEGIKLSDDECARLSIISSLVAARRTSKDEDEAVCLQSLMEREVDVILDTRPEDRLEVFFSYFHQLPVDIAFCRLKRNNKVGWRWAPNTLLDKLTLPTSRRFEPAILGKAGLLVRTVGWILRGQSLASQKIWRFSPNEGSEDYMYYIIPDPFRGKFPTDEPSSGRDGSFLFERTKTVAARIRKCMQDESITSVACIVHPSLMGAFSDPVVSRDALLCILLEENRSFIKVGVFCHCLVRNVYPSDTGNDAWDIIERNETKNTHAFIPSRRMSSSQTWLLT